jgi:hypothetical protein
MSIRTYTVDVSTNNKVMAANHPNAVMTVEIFRDEDRIKEIEYKTWDGLKEGQDWSTQDLFSFFVHLAGELASSGGLYKWQQEATMCVIDNVMLELKNPPPAEVARRYTHGD